MVHPAPEQIYELILEDYFFSLVDRGVPAEETPLFTGNLKEKTSPLLWGAGSVSPIKKLFLHLAHAQEEVAL
jgi:hypothetical protein